MSYFSSPIPVASLPAYFQGRPNTLFLSRYGTLEERTIRTRA